MSREIREIHVGFGDYSIRYRVGQRFETPENRSTSQDAWGRITRIEYDQHESYKTDKLAYRIFAYNHSGVDAKEELCKHVIGLPVELTYKSE